MVAGEKTVFGIDLVSCRSRIDYLGNLHSLENSPVYSSVGVSPYEMNYCVPPASILTLLSSLSGFGCIFHHFVL
ncbi:hypothetical protein ACFLWR_00420 [Chloroflexota bacterium]